MVTSIPPEYYCIANNPLRINSQVGGEWKSGVPFRVVNARRTDKKYAENTATTLTKNGRREPAHWFRQESAEKQFGKTFNTRSLALEANLSPSYLQRLFKYQTGITMGKWLSETRLSRAAQLLANGYMSVKQIAHSVGYEHTSSFIRAFERRFARTPACFRRQIDRTKR